MTEFATTAGHGNPAAGRARPATIWRRYLVVGVVFVLFGALLPDVWSQSLRLGVEASSLIAVLIGIRLYRPAAAGAWWLLGASAGLGLAADAIRVALVAATHTRPGAFLYGI